MDVSWCFLPFFPVFSCVCSFYSRIVSFLFIICAPPSLIYVYFFLKIPIDLICFCYTVCVCVRERERERERETLSVPICVYVSLCVYTSVCMYVSMCMSVYVYLYPCGRGQLVGMGSFFPQAVGMENRSSSLLSAFNDKYLYLLSHHLTGPTSLSSVYFIPWAFS